MTYICIILYLITSSLMLYTIDVFMSVIATNILHKKTGKFPYVYLCFSTAYYIVHIECDAPILEYILLLCSYGFLFVSMQKKYLANTLKIIYIVALYLSISSVLHSIVRTVVSLFYSNYLNQIIKLTITIFVSILILLVITNIQYKWNRAFLFQTNVIPNYVYVLILLATFFSGGLIESQITITDEQVRSVVNRLFTIITIFLLIFIIASLVFNCISKSYFENVSSILEKQVNAQVDYYKKVDRLNKDLRDFRHDYKNHMICVQGLLDAQEYDEAREYIHGITLRKTILSKDFASGNSIADALLSDKAECAEEIGAELQFKGVIFEDIPSVDLCTILSNAIDNAIEACEKISSNEPKIILVKCSYIKHIQFIWISNPVAEDVKIINNTVETSKADKNIHGIGLYNIRRTVAKYEGEFEISCNDKMFVMDIGFKVD